MQPDPTAAAGQPVKTNTERLADAAHRMMQAERTEDPDAIRRAEAYLKFFEDQVSAEGALERQSQQAEAEYAADPEAFWRRRHDDALAADNYLYPAA